MKKNKKKYIILISLIIITIIIISIFIIYKKLYKTKETVSKSYNSFYLTSLDNESTKEIEDKNNSLDPLDTIYFVNNVPIEKIDIDAEKNKLSNYSDESKKILCKSDNAVIETIKQSVAQQETINLGYTISSSQEETFKNIAESFYENSDKTIAKDNYIKKWIDIQKRDELATLFKADSITKITQNKLVCNDENVQKEIENFQDNKTAENLNKAYNEYLMYIIKEYNIKY